jgi:hypothetical protein
MCEWQKEYQKTKSMKEEKQRSAEDMHGFQIEKEPI